MGNKENNGVPMKSWKDLLCTMRDLHLPWGWIVVGLSMNLLLNNLMLRLPDTTADLLSGDMSGAALRGAIWFYVLLGVVSFLMVAGQVQAETYSTRKARETIWKKMLSMKMKHYDNHDPSKLMSTISNDVSDAVSQSVNIMVYLIPNLYYIVMALVRINEYHWILALACIAIFPLKFLYASIMGKKLYQSTTILQSRIGTLIGFLADRINHLPLIKVYTNEQEEIQNGENTCKDLLDANMKIVHINNIATAIASLLDILQKFIVVVVAVMLLQRGSITIAMWLAFFLFSQNLFSVMDQAVNSWIQIKGVHGKFARVIEVMQGEDEQKNENACVMFPEEGDIHFQNVMFSYPKTDTPAVMNLSFTVPRGSSLAIVGLCGSGKTTSISLLERFYEPQQGSIQIGDTNIQDISLTELRKRFSYVQQGADVFSGTIREAITYGIDREITDEEILCAAKSTGFIEYLNLCENGLDSDVASGGVSMSGGQSQRLVLTRELLRNGDFVLMDEPTSALDIRVSKMIQVTMNEIFANKTRILVTHDLELVVDYDQIMVMEHGNMVGIGTHEELMETCSLYRQMQESAKAQEEDA